MKSYTKESIINKTRRLSNFYKIPPHLPLPAYGRKRKPKGGTPLFGKEGMGRFSQKLCLINYGLVSKILMLIVTFWSVAIPLWAGNPVAVSGDESLQSASKTDPSATEKQWGIKTLSMRQSAAGYMLDFRYQVTDPEKASILLDRKIKPYLIDQATGTKLYVPNMPKVGSLKQRVVSPDVDKTYFILFGNLHGLVKSGSKVTVVIGDFREENLVVE